MILLCHRFDNKVRRRKCGNLQRQKKNKNEKKKNLNPEQHATHIHKPTKFPKKKKKNLNPEQPTTTNYQNSLKIEADREREQYIEIKESKKHVLITSK